MTVRALIEQLSQLQLFDEVRLSDGDKDYEIDELIPTANGPRCLIVISQSYEWSPR